MPQPSNPGRFQTRRTPAHGGGPEPMVTGMVPPSDHIWILAEDHAAVTRAATPRCTRHRAGKPNAAMYEPSRFGRLESVKERRTPPIPPSALRVKVELLIAEARGGLLITHRSRGDAG